MVYRSFIRSGLETTTNFIITPGAENVVIRFQPEFHRSSLRRSVTDLRQRRTWGGGDSACWAASSTHTPPRGLRESRARGMTYRCTTTEGSRGTPSRRQGGRRQPGRYLGAALVLAVVGGCPFPRFSILASAPCKSPPPTAGCLVLISQKATLTSKLQTTRASLRQAEDRGVGREQRAQRSGTARPGPRGVVRRRQDSRVRRPIEGPQAARPPSSRRRSARRSARKNSRAPAPPPEPIRRRSTRAETTSIAALGGQRAWRTPMYPPRRGASGWSRFGARASRDDGADDWRDIITDIIHPSHLYDRKPKDGTSHHLSGDEERRGSRRRTRRRRTGRPRRGSGRTIFRRDRSRYRSCGRRCDARAEGGGRFHPFAT